VESGAIRALAGGMAERLRTLPNLPTMQEQGMNGYECYTWNAILVPAGTPQRIVERLSGAVQKAMQDPAVLKRLQEVGVDPTPGRGPKETAAFIKAELAKWAPIIKASGAQVD
jgi:tripartite-type tricarboxylate transporter receptor subunit TctC